MLRTARAVGFLLLLLGVWQILATLRVWPPYLFPTPSGVADALWYNTRNTQIPDALAISLTRLAVGFAISVAVGLLIGLAIGTVQWMDDTVGRLVLGFQSLPSITWLPIAVLWFGLSERAIIFVVLMGSVFSVAISARSAARNMPRLLVRAAQTFGANRWQMYRHVLLPGMMPEMIQGLKLGWSFAWRSLMAGELLFVGLGLGHLLNVGRDLNDISLVVAVMLVIVAVGLVIDRVLFGRLEAWIRDRWGATGVDA